MPDADKSLAPVVAPRSTESKPCMPDAEIGEAETRPSRESDSDAVEDGTVWTEVFSGKPRVDLRGYVNLRAEAEAVLGKLKDSGIYTFSDKGDKASGRLRLRAVCNLGACKDCTRVVRAAVHYVGGVQNFVLRARGRHGTLQPPRGGQLWMVAELYVIRQYCDDCDAPTTQGIRAAMKKANLPLRCSGDQLRSFAFRPRTNKVVPRKHTAVTVAELQAAAAPYFFPEDGQWEKQPLSKLLVLRDSVFGPEHVCVMWTCPGMLRRACAAQGKVVKLAVDGKQKVLSNEYTVLTLSFLASNESLTKTWAGRWHSSSVASHTATQEPFLQALANSESELNITCLFNQACDLAASCCKLDLRNQVWQVHKDYAKGIEASRKKVFPAARPCDDYPHMRRASYKVLQKHLAALKTKGDATFGVLDRIIRLSRAVPTVQMFDAVWQLAFAWLEKLCRPAAKYLQDTYFSKHAPESLHKVFHCTKALWGAEKVWFAGFWAGILGTYPGSSSGNQALESFHGYWQARVANQSRATPTTIFKAMESLYAEDWCSKFAWAESRAFVTWPDQHSAALLNSQALRSVGRSPAVDYWKERGPKLCGNCNHCKVSRSTDASKDVGDPAGVTTLWVMRCQKVKELAAASAVVTKDTADIIAGLICTEGDNLAKWLSKAGISTQGETPDGSHINIDKLEHFLSVHCAVISGHLADQCWPRARRKLKQPIPGKLCTCVEFLMHADCEHIVFVKALCGQLEANLNEIPTVSKKGRKRKGDAAPKPKAKRRRQLQT